MKSANLPIIGDICGDILGSCYEGSRIKQLDLALCLFEDQFTDDTVCTIAVADAIINNLPFDMALRKWCLHILAPDMEAHSVTGSDQMIQSLIIAGVTGQPCESALQEP